MEDTSERKPLRILLLEDNARDRELIERALAADGLACEFIHATSQEDFENALTQKPIDVILADFSLPGYSGMAALEKARELRAEVPFILVSGSIGEERAVETFRSGATDYLTKSRVERLGPAVRRALKEAKMRQAHHEAEIALRDSERCFRSVWECSVDGMRLTNAEGQIVAVNEAFCRLTKRAREDLVGKVFSVTYAGHGPVDGIDVYKRRFETGTINSRIVAPAKLWNGDELNLEISSSFIELGDTGKVLLSIFRDVTERTEAEARVAVFAHLAKKLSAAQTAREAAEIIVDTADELLGWDACTFDLYSVEENRLDHVLNADLLEGKRTEFAPRYDQESPVSLAEKAIKEGGQLILREDGAGTSVSSRRFGDISRSSESIMIVPIREGANVIGVMSIQTYAAKAYGVGSLEILQALADHCGGALNRIRTEEALRKAQEELRQSQKMEAVGQLAGGVAHDFNNMLTVMRGNAELLLLSPEDFSKQTKDCLHQITAAAERAAKLTRQLLAFSRKQVMQSQALDLNDLVANLSKMLNRVIGEHIRLECHYGVRLPFVQADGGMLEQVLVNLVVNARDAMPNGGHLYVVTERVVLDEAHVRVNPEARAGEFVCLTVRDTGSGISAEDLPRIFEPFFTTKEVGKGTGLGLSTVYGIVKQHQGWIEVFSQPGAGTTFKTLLPAIPPPTTPEATPSTEVRRARGSETILLVEDDEAVRTVTKRILSGLGYKIYEAISAREAMGVWEKQKEKIALLLSDVVMPGGASGRDLADQLRGEKPALKVILMSGYSPEMAGRDTMYFRQTNTRFLQKPCSEKVLAETVRQCLDTAPN